MLSQNSLEGGRGSQALLAQCTTTLACVVGGLECENQGKGPAKRASLTEPAQGQAGKPQAGEGEEV